MKQHAFYMLGVVLAAPAVNAQTEDAGGTPASTRAALRNPFAPISWQPPAVAPMVAPPVKPAPRVAAPLAPPLPFRYLGSYTAEVPLVVLMMGEQMIVAKAGDTLEGGWRIDSLGPRLIEFTYLPLKLKRSLPTGGAG